MFAYRSDGTARAQGAPRAAIPPRKACYCAIGLGDAEWLPYRGRMFFRQFLYDETACASYLLGCKTHSVFGVVDPHADLVDDYIAAAGTQGARIAAVLEPHVQADHVSGLPELVERTGARAYLPAGADVEFEHVALADGELVELG